MSEKLSASAVRHKVESEATVSNEVELDFTQTLECKPHPTEKVKQFQAACIQNHISKRVRYVIDKEILGSGSGLYLEFQDKNLPHYHKGMEMRYLSKEELFVANEIKSVIVESQHK